MQFYVDSVQVGPPVTNPPPYLLSWDSTTVTDGSHVFSASATDTFGMVGESAPITATVDNSHPPKLIGKEVTVWVDGSDTMSTIVFSTAIPNDLLVAFVAYDGPLNASQTASIRVYTDPHKTERSSPAFDNLVDKQRLDRTQRTVLYGRELRSP